MRAELRRRNIGRAADGNLLGDSSGLPRTLRDDFRNTGMTYIIAIPESSERTRQL